MDYEAYKKKFFADPPPAPRFIFGGIQGTTLFFKDYDRAIGYYTEVLGDPAYMEGSGTRGWQIGETWLTLLAGGSGVPGNVEIAIVMPTPEDAAALQAAFIAAGAEGPEPSRQLMYWPVYACPVTDPFGTQIWIYSRLNTDPAVMG